MNRRDLLKISAFAGLAAIATQASAETCATDGTPNQFTAPGCWFSTPTM